MSASSYAYNRISRHISYTGDFRFLSVIYYSNDIPVKFKECWYDGKKKLFLNTGWMDGLIHWIRIGR